MSKSETRQLFHHYVQSCCITVMSFQQYVRMTDFCAGRIEFEELLSAFPDGAVEEVSINN